MQCSLTYSPITLSSTKFKRASRIRQRSLVITLLDLKNAFGEVHHNLNQSVLGYHHIPQHIQLMVKSLSQTLKHQSSHLILTPHL